MSTRKEMPRTKRRFGSGSHGYQKPIRDISKEKWLQKYASRILGLWSQWQTPLGVAPAYTGKIKVDLATFYEDPLKKMFVESTY